MVVVVILSILAAISTPLFSRDNNARKGRGWANLVAQTLQKGRFQAMGDRTNIHLKFYRTHIDTYREEPGGSLTLLSSAVGPVEDGDPTVAIWAAQKNPTDATQPPAARALPDSPPPEIVFSSLGSTSDNANWRIYIRNELLPAAHPDAGFVINVVGLTGFVSTTNMWRPE
jgi:Tfp pilus assembly protein FimT